MRKQKGILLLTMCIAALVSSVVVYTDFIEAILNRGMETNEMNHPDIEI